MERHFTSSVYVYHPATRRFLFIRHKKLKKWLQPGGHVEKNELPDEAAKREVLEETGLRVYLHGERRPRETDETRPYAIQRNVIAEGEHEHLDLVYLGIPENPDAPPVRNDAETDGIAWFSLEEIQGPDFDTFDAQKHWCGYFYGLMNP